MTLDSLELHVKMADKQQAPKFSVNKCIADAADRILQVKHAPQDLKEECMNISKGRATTISTTSLRKMYKICQDEGFNIKLHKMMEGSVFVPPTVTLPPRNPELEARIQKLKIAEENREYKRITRNVTRKGERTFTFQDDVKSMNRQMIAMFNFALTVIAGFAFGYKGMEYVVGKVFPLQMMTGLILGTIVFFVDLYFIMRYGV